MNSEEAYKKIKDIYRRAQAEIDALGKEHKKHVEQAMQAADQKKIKNIRQRIEKL